MKYIVIALVAFVLGGGLVFAFLNVNNPQQLETEMHPEYPVVYILDEDASLPDQAPQLLSHQLEIISENEFLYSADGHMTYDRVRGEIVEIDGEYDFVVTESYQGRFDESDVLFTLPKLGADELQITWKEAIPLVAENATFTLQSTN